MAGKQYNPAGGDLKGIKTGGLAKKSGLPGDLAADYFAGRVTAFLVSHRLPIAPEIFQVRMAIGAEA